MRNQVVSAIFLKECLDTLRDRRTLLMMIVIPVLLYPTMLLVGAQVALVHSQHTDSMELRVAVARKDMALLGQWLRLARNVVVDEAVAPLDALTARTADASVLVEESGAAERLASGEVIHVKVYADHTDYRSGEAALRVKRVLEDMRTYYEKQRVKAAGVVPEFLKPVEIKGVDTATSEKRSGVLLGFLLPMMIVLMVAMGAFYPAVDMTAGEKERGTFETLLSTPASRLEIILGKYGAVVLLAMTTGLLNLAAMGLSFWVIFSQAAFTDGVHTFELQMPVWVFFSLALVMLPLALLISAVMMSVSVFARSFKEAQNFLMPVFILMVLPAALAALPGMKPNLLTNAIPILNTALLFRSLLTGEAGWGMIATVMGSMSFFALLALWTAIWLFQREEIVLADKASLPLPLRRSAIKPSAVPSATLASVLFAIVLLLYFYVGIPLQRHFDLGGILATQWGLFFLPIMTVLWYMRIPAFGALRLRACSWGAVCIALLLGVCVSFLVMRVGLYQEDWLPVPTAMRDQFDRLAAYTGSLNGKLLLIFVFAITPAVCEEMLFRGLLFSGMRTAMGPVSALVVCALLFAMMHFSLYQFLPTLLIGVMLGYLVWRTDSLLPAILLHALNNTLALYVVLSDAKWVEQGLRSGTVFFVGAAGLILGIAGMEWLRKKNA